MYYFTRPPFFLKSFFRNSTWSIKTSQDILYLTFDDGPHPIITNFVLDELKKFNAKATFFCIGKNVELYPAVYNRILEEGHETGNHTFSHLNGWKTKDVTYLDDIEKAKRLISGHLFRPPYGKITSFQLQQLSLKRFTLNPIMWTVLSGDFDPLLKPEKCGETVILKAGKGDIIVFHDSEKAFTRLKVALPMTLRYFTEKDFQFHSIQESLL
ncbi:MAG: polysaccharide deacetylase family protein [Ferruginibacter sp.]